MTGIDSFNADDDDIYETDLEEDFEGIPKISLIVIFTDQSRLSCLTLIEEGPLWHEQCFMLRKGIFHVKPVQCLRPPKRQQP